MGSQLFALITISILSFSIACEAKLDPFAKSIQIDPNFSYYKDRSPESIAAEIKANGFGAVRRSLS
ncbi:MAG: hypothetical protein QME62_03010 [Armatimonadota bacterium]|nr:hypothetical protein [Armatimonadota bacterium]